MACNKNENKLTSKNALLIGLMLALAFSIRFQTIIFSAGFGLALLLLRVQFRYLVLIIVGFLATSFVTLGLLDIYVWGKPFVEFMAYVQYNIDNATVYGVDVWHMYISLVLGLLIPPISILVFSGYFKNWKKEPLLFLALTFYFLHFIHTFQINKNVSYCQLFHL